MTNTPYESHCHKTVIFLPLKYCASYAVSIQSVKSRSKMLVSSLFCYQKGPRMGALSILYKDMNC